MQKELIQTTLNYISFKYAYYNFFLLLFSLFQNKLTPFGLPLGILIVQELFFWKYYSQHQIMPQLQHILHILAGIYVLFVYYLNWNYYIFVNVFIFVSFIIGLKSNQNELIQHEYTIIFKYVKGFYSFAILIASICVTIKLNEFVFWTWSQTFWWYWMYLSAVIGSAFTVLMILISKLINQFYYTRQILHPSEYKTLGWIFYVLLMSSIISGAWIINTFESLGIDLNIHINEYVTVIMIGTHFIIFCFGTYRLMDDIAYFFAFLLNQDITQRELPNSPKQEEIKKKQAVTQTIVMKQISSAFFQKANTRVTENFTTNNEIFTERANQSQNIVVDNNEKFKRIKKHKKRTDLDGDVKRSSLSNQMCIICCEKQANAVLMKCGHGGVCFECAFENIQKNKECFLCRQQVIEIYEIEREEEGNFLKVISKTRI